MTIHPIDLVVIVVYLVGIVAVGIWFSRHQRGSSTGYFLASRSLSWVTVGLALFATNISTVHLTGLAGAGFSDGMRDGLRQLRVVGALFVDPVGYRLCPFLFPQ